MSHRICQKFIPRVWERERERDGEVGEGKLPYCVLEVSGIITGRREYGEQKERTKERKKESKKRGLDGPRVLTHIELSGEEEEEEEPY